jgi:hypothetical protein
MDLIYATAKIAIVAATGSNNSHGLWEQDRPQGLHSSQ